MIVAEVSIVPIGTESASLSKYVAKAFNKLKSFKEIKVELSAMATILESDDLDKIFQAIKEAKEEVFKMGVKRVVVYFKMDERRDKNLSIKSKLESVKRNL
ncbi:MAG: MTH1187 family thiamine-binding protein [Candidatus Odinarchaeia archaeon]